MLVSRRADLGDAGLRHLLQLQARQEADRRLREQGQAERQAREDRENAAWHAVLLPAARAHGAVAAQGGDPSPTLLPLVLPSGPRRQRVLSQRRRQRHRQHLVAALATLDGKSNTPTHTPPEATPDSAATAPAPGPVGAGRLCAACRGGCCTLGGDFAYIGASTLRRVMLQRPGATADDILALYLSCLPDRSMQGSCIHHTAQGCNLPQDLRSDICNQFECQALQQLKSAGPAVQAVVVVQRQQSHWHRDVVGLDNRITRGLLLTEAGITSLKGPGPSEA